MLSEEKKYALEKSSRFHDFYNILNLPNTLVNSLIKDAFLQNKIQYQNIPRLFFQNRHTKLPVGSN